MGKRCIITGGSGFIGTHLINYLLGEREYHEIHVLDIRPPQIRHPAVQFYQCDIRQPINHSLKGKFEVCFHLAALSKEPGFPWDDYFQTNYIGTLNVIDFVENQKVNNIVFTSTMMVYRAGEQPMREDALTAPDTAYGISKLLSELALQAWMVSNPKHRLRIVRPGVVFGKGENGNFTRLYHALKKGYFFYIGRKDTIKSCIYVKDVVRFLVLLASEETNRPIYNMAYPNPPTIAEICEAFFEVFQFRRRVFTVPYSLALLGGYFFEILNNLGILKSSIHHRRIQKLYYSTHIVSEAMKESGFQLQFTLKDALADWKRDCRSDELY